MLSILLGLVLFGLTGTVHLYLTVYTVQYIFPGTKLDCVSALILGNTENS